MKINMIETGDSWKKQRDRSKNCRRGFETVVSIIKMLKKTLSIILQDVRRATRSLNTHSIMMTLRSMSCPKHTSITTIRLLIDESPCLRSTIEKNSPVGINTNPTEINDRVYHIINRVEIFQIKEISQGHYKAARR